VAKFLEDDIGYLIATIRIVGHGSPSGDLSRRKAGSLPARLSLAALDEGLRLSETLAIFLAHDPVDARPFRALYAQVALAWVPFRRGGAPLGGRRLGRRSWRVLVEHKGIRHERRKRR